MDKDSKDLLKKQIEDEISSATRQIEALEEKTKPISPDCSLGRLTRLEAMGESHVANKTLDNARLRLTRLKNALQRIDTPSFGICIDCDEPIDINRLKLRPESVRCVACENEQNR
ncbi:MAG TPA: transcriptional regulator [Epsilonproteobacteria bacterium]|nr:transcriptional regulator [Campylobacterota bacterium]